MSPTRTIAPEASDSSIAPRVVIADRCIATRLGMRVALERDGFVVVGEATTSVELVKTALTERPDACLVDLDLPGGGIAAAQAIGARLATTIVVMLTSSDNGDDVLAAVRAGASGYVPKTIDGQRLAAVVRGVLAGEAAIPRSMVGRLLDEIRDGGAVRRRNLSLLQRRVHLTVREWQVVDLMSDEMTTREIAARLGIAEVTVRRHVSEVLRKLNAPDRKSALRLLQRGGAHASGTST